MHFTKHVICLLNFHYTCTVIIPFYKYRFNVNQEFIKVLVRFLAI